MATKEWKDMSLRECTALKETDEGKAASALTDALNSFSWKPELFAMALRMEHRTLQQSVFRTCIAVIQEFAKDDFGTDGRNQHAHELAKRIVDSGVLENSYLPMV